MHSLRPRRVLRHPEPCAVLDPQVVLRADREPAGQVRRGVLAVAKQAMVFSKLVQKIQPVIVNGAPGIISWLPNGKPMAVLGFVVAQDKIVEIYVISNPDRLRRLTNLPVLSDRTHSSID